MWFMLGGGFLLLIAGGELLIRGAVSIARHFEVSPLMIGLTLVGFGTSTPELVTSIQSALAGSPGLAVGNVVGSNTANILMILGLAAVIRPVTATPTAFRRDGAMLVVTTVACVAVTSFGSLNRLIGLIFLGLLLLYIVITYRLERERSNPSADLHKAEADLAHAAPGGLIIAIVSLVGGLAVTILGARFLVEGAIDLALGWGVSETIIGLTIVAVGTSLPELVTSLLAAFRGQSDIALGNVVGSNIYNVLGILGLTAVVTPMTIPSDIARFDIWIMVAATAALLLATTSGWRITRLEGGTLVLAYAGYVIWLGVVASSTS